MFKKFHLFLFIIIIFTLSSTTFSQRYLLEEKEEELSDDIIILHTNDVHCGIEDAIGYDGLMLYKKELLTKYKNVLLVDAGDHIQGGSIGLLSKGEDIIEIMNEIGYDVVTIGNHEFDYGLEQLNKISKMINTGYICANFLYRQNKTNIFEPYKIVQVDDVSIGFIGVLTPQTLTKTYLHNLVDKDGNLIYDFLSEQKGQQLYKKIQEYIDDLRNKKNVNYVIILAHLGNDGDAIEEFTSKGFLEHIKGVNAILDGHSHKIYNYTLRDKDGKDVIVSQTGTKLTNVGKITIKKSGEITSEMINEIPIFDGYTNFTVIPRGDIPRAVDPDINGLINNIYESHSHEFNQIIGYTDFDLLLYRNNSKDSSSQTSRFQENALCDLVADAFRYIGDGEITLVNAGSIREEIKKGNITYNDILNTLPFSADIVVKEVSGKDILDALEYGMRSLPGVTSRFPQVSGIKFKVDETIKSPVIIDDDENFMRVDGERRVYDVYVGDEKLDENKKYKISFDNYIAEGGDGFSMFKNYSTINETLKVDNDAFKIYIETVLNNVIPDKYNKTQGRIVKKQKDRGNDSAYLINFLGNYLILILYLLF